MIGIFDSGVGGMTVARAIEQHCPGLPLIYFGDIARTPYGSKSRSTIIDYARHNTELLLKHGASIIVIACNSAASVATEVLREQYPVPVLDVVGPAVEQAVQVSRSGRIGVIGTRATVRSGIYERSIQTLLPSATVLSQACPLLVPLVEEGWLSRRETKMILRRYLYPLRLRQIDTLVLGCTHYPLLGHLIGPRIGRRVQLIDSSLAVAHHLHHYLQDHPDLAERVRRSGQQSRFLVSDCTEAIRQLARKIFGRPIDLESIHV